MVCLNRTLQTGRIARPEARHPAQRCFRTADWDRHSSLLNRLPPTPGRLADVYFVLTDTPHQDGCLKEAGRVSRPGCRYRMRLRWDLRGAVREMHRRGSLPGFLQTPHPDPQEFARSQNREAEFADVPHRMSP